MPVLAGNSHLIGEAITFWKKTATVFPTPVGVPASVDLRKFREQLVSFSLSSAPFVKLPCVPGDQISGDAETGRSGRRRQKAGSLLPQDLSTWWDLGFFEGL